MDEQRLIQVESKIAYQEKMIQELNDVVYAQRQQIERLENTCKFLVDRLKTVETMASDDSFPDEKPPHY